jgi:hypothetical protein
MFMHTQKKEKKKSWARRWPPTEPTHRTEAFFSHNPLAKVRVAVAESVESPAHSLSLEYNNSSMNMMKM